MELVIVSTLVATSMTTVRSKVVNVLYLVLC